MKLAWILILVITPNLGHAAPALSRVENENTVVRDPLNKMITNLFISSTAGVFMSWISFLIPPINKEARLIVLLTATEASLLTLDQALTVPIYQTTFIPNNKVSDSDMTKIIEGRNRRNDYNQQLFH